jgi:thiamine-monophosphate kinase
VGDDCAIIEVNPNIQMVTSVDTLIAGVHFPINTSASDIAYKALAVNLSDLAAMGATPKHFTLALTLPEINEPWLDEFSASLKQLSEEYSINLVGGDTTKGALSITINVMGEVEQGKALLRSSAQVGDLIFVSNTVGDSAYAWQQIQQGNAPSVFYLDRLNRPTPQVLLGQQLSGIANACIDISDGLEQDLSHILKYSNVGATINLADIPLSDEMIAYIENTHDWCTVLAGGDDYELCFTVPAENLKDLEAVKNKTNIQLTQIGVVTKSGGLSRLGYFDQECKSYQHF